MLYMSGGGVQIFSIGIVFMLLLSPFKNIAGMNEGAYFDLWSIFCELIIRFRQRLYNMRLQSPQIQGH